MSRANAKARKVNDKYPTPPTLARAICARILDTHWPPPAFGNQVLRVLEPSAGSGAFVKALRDEMDARGGAMRHITALDVVDYSAVNPADKFVVGDCIEIAKAAKVSAERFHLIIGNPPFSFAEAHIRALIPLLAPGGVLCFILRVNFFGSLERNDTAFALKHKHIAEGQREFFIDCPEEKFELIVPRPQFTLNKEGKPGSDGTEYALFTWRERGAGTGIDLQRRGAPIRWVPGPDDKPKADEAPSAPNAPSVAPSAGAAGEFEGAGALDIEL